MQNQATPNHSYLRTPDFARAFQKPSDTKRPKNAKCRRCQGGRMECFPCNLTVPLPFCWKLKKGTLSVSVLGNVQDLRSKRQTRPGNRLGIREPGFRLRILFETLIDLASPCYCWRPCIEESCLILSDPMSIWSLSNPCSGTLAPWRKLHFGQLENLSAPNLDS